jgi:hypothetical protein
MVKTSGKRHRLSTLRFLGLKQKPEAGDYAGPSFQRPESAMGVIEVENSGAITVRAQASDRQHNRQQYGRSDRPCRSYWDDPGD